MAHDVGAPYCSHCNYDLSGLTESTRCPECGRPLVEVLQRRGYGTGSNRYSKRYRSKATLFGWPVIDIALGPRGDEKIGKARGIIAIGDTAVGLLAIGGFCVGVLSVGGITFGVLSLGGVAGSVLASLGGIAVSGGIAVGGTTVGMIASGGAAFGLIAQGGGAIGHWVRDGRHMRHPPEVFSTYRWLLGADVATMLLFPLFWVLVAQVITAAAIVAPALLRLRKFAQAESASPGA